TSHVIAGEVKNVHTVRTGIEYMIELAAWYQANCRKSSIGFFQIGGGIAGDFPICVVPMLEQDLGISDIPRWGYFCQISDSTTSYGSYSGAVPNEKITWGKLSAATPKFIIESDATIVALLIFAYVLGEISTATSRQTTVAETALSMASESDGVIRVHDWTPQDAAELYRVESWGDSFFFINGKGHAAVR